MANYIGQCITPKIPSRYFCKVLVPEGGLRAGQVVYVENLTTDIDSNIEVFVATQPATVNLPTRKLALIINDGFEALSDGRRPAGQPNYYEYQYSAGDIATAIFVDGHLMFNVSSDTLDPATIGIIDVGSYLIPVDGSNTLTVSATKPTSTAVALRVLATCSTPIGGLYGGQFATSYICVSDVEYIDSGNSILTYGISGQEGATVINSTNHTISLTMPYGTDVRALIATFILSRDATVAIGETPQVSGTTDNDFTSDVVYAVTSEKGEEQNWTVTVTLAQNHNAEISAYTIATGTETIDSENGTIDIVFPALTDLTELVATFTLSTGATASVGETPQVSGVTINDFTNPVVYTVTAEDGVTTKDWTVTATFALNDEAEIITYTIPTGTETIDSENGTIGIVFPALTDLTELVATFTLSAGATASVGETPQVSGATANAFTNPVVYTVTAEDGVNTKDWTVTATLEA